MQLPDIPSPHMLDQVYHGFWREQVKGLEDSIGQKAGCSRWGRPRRAGAGAIFMVQAGHIGNGSGQAGGVGQANPPFRSHKEGRLPQGEPGYMT